MEGKRLPQEMPEIHPGPRVKPIASMSSEPRPPEPPIEETGASPKGPSQEGAAQQPAMNRPPLKKLYKIGEVMRYSGLSRQTIHNYTMLGLITEEERTPSGHRLYGESVFYRLERIQRLKQRMSLKEVREALGRGEE